MTARFINLVSQKKGMDDHKVFLVFLIGTLLAYAVIFTAEITGFLVKEEQLSLEVKDTFNIRRHAPGDVVTLEMRLRSSQQSYPAEVIIFYSIQDKDFHDLVYREDTFAIAGKDSTFTRLIRIPDVRDGQYYAFAEARLAADEKIRARTGVPLYISGASESRGLSLSVPLGLLFLLAVAALKYARR